MGKPKVTGERVKGNLKPSSSSRAAELLGGSGLSSGVTLGLTFSSFSQISSSSRTISAGSSMEAVGSELACSELSTEVQVILKKLGKRNATTKLKALDELLALLKVSEVEELYRFLPAWVGFYGRLSADLERRIRLVANQILAHTLVKVGKQVAPHLKLLLGPWLLSIHDPSKDVSATAKFVFEELFPQAKQSSALRFSHPEILELIETNLVVHTPESFSDSRFYTKEEVSQRYARLIVSTLGAFGFMLEKIPAEARTDHPIYSELLSSSSKFYGYFSHEDSSIRNSCYRLTARLVTDAPELFNSQLAQFSTHFLMKAMQEKNPTCHPAMLDAVLIATQKSPTLWLGTKKSSLSRLVQFIENGCYGSVALVYPALPLLLSHLPASILTSKGISSLLVTLLSPLGPPSLAYKTAGEVCVALADTNSLQAPLKDELAGLLVAKSVEILSQGYFNSDQPIPSEGASTLVLKVMNHLRSQNMVNEADDYANEIEALLSDLILQEELLPNEELMKVVSMMEGLGLHRRNFLGEAGGQIQDLFYAILDHLLCLGMEKLQGEKAKFPNCFNLLCLAQSHLVHHLQPDHQTRTREFFRTEMVKLMPTYDIALGLSIIDTFGDGFDFLELVKVASQPTNVVPYAAKVELTSYLLDKPAPLDGVEAWLISTLQNLMLVPELNTPPGVAWKPGKLESLLAKVLVLPAGKFSPKLYTAFAGAFPANMERFLARAADSSIPTQRLGGVVTLLSRVVANMLSHPGYEIGMDRLGAPILAQLIGLFPPYANHSALQGKELCSAWGQVLRSGKLEVTRPILEPLMSFTASQHSIALAEEVSKIAAALLQADWPIGEIDKLVSLVCPPPAAWAKLHTHLVLQHDVNLENFSLTFPEGYILSPESRDFSLEASNDHTLGYILSFSATLISSLPKQAKSCGSQLAIYCFLTDVLFSWVEMVIAEQDLDGGLNLELADSAWQRLEKVGLGFSFQAAPPQGWPSLLSLVYAMPNSITGLTSLAAGLVWVNAIKKNSYSVPEAWQQWLVDAATLEPSKGASLLRGTALLAGSLQKPATLQAFQSNLADRLTATSPANMAELISADAISTASNHLLLFYSLLSFELPRPKCQALNYWAIATLKLAPPSHRSQPMFWGLLIPILEFTIANSYHQPSASLAVEPIVAQDQVWKDILDSYASVFDVIRALLKAPASPLAYLIKRNTLALLEAVVGLSSGQFSELVSWPQHRGSISKLILELVLAEYLTKEVPLRGPRFAFVSQLSSCVSLISLTDLEAESPTNQLCGLLHSKHPALARSAAKLLLLLLPSQIQSAKGQLDALPPPRIPLPLIALAQQGQLTSSFGQLLAWLLILRSCELASYELKLVYTEQIQSSGGIQPLVSLVIDLLGIAEPHPFDCGAWDVTGILLDGLEATPFPGLPLLAAHLYFRLLQVLPSLARAWWIGCSNRNLIQNFESYTERHFSGRLVAAAMEHVSHPESQAKLVDEAFTYRVTRSEVTATYLVDECPIEILLRLPSAHPLKLAEVEGHRHAGVPEKQWRAWLLGSTTILTSQNGTIFDALEQFKANASLHFEGKSDCMICYSIVGVLDRSLPNRQCRTCRNKFHAGCLYKWIQSSSQSTCPLCRNLF